MPTQNSLQRFGSVARTLHWLTALLILTAIPLGLVANRLPYDTADALAWKAQVFSVHKTIGVAAFFVALARILWALTQIRPASLHAASPHPGRRAEALLADLVHWMLYISLLAVPLSGWVHHAAVTGFAPILWPLGQGLPFVPQSETVATLAGAAHWLFTKLLVVSILLHIAGALKHHLIDRDATLRRMTRGEEAPANPQKTAHGKAPLLAALAIYAAGAALAGNLAQQPPADATLPTAALPNATATATATATDATARPASTGNWQVTEGTLDFSVQQMGARVQGSFARWTADIDFDPVAVAGKHGTVTVRIDTTSLTLGSVTEQAKAADFFDVAGFPEASFAADILPDGAGYVAQGTLTLRGATNPVSLPFTLQISGDTAVMAGSTTLDRRAFGMGAAYGDEATVGFVAEVSIALAARKTP